MSKQVRYQLVMPEWLKESLRDHSCRKSVSMAELIKDALKFYIHELDKGCK